MVRKAVMHGVDLSHWNVVADWDMLSKEAEFVMLKIGGEEGKKGVFKPDKKFLEYYKQAVVHGLHVGGYFFAGNKPEIIKESNIDVEEMCLKINGFLKHNGIFFDMPIAIDFENQNPAIKMSNTNYVWQWCEIMESLNYYATIYASDVSGFNECLFLDRLVAYDKWVARYGKEPELDKYGMWQYSSTAIVKGVDGRVDMNYAYINYPEVISRKRLNK